jgi:hypothetical protein
MASSDLREEQRQRYFTQLVDLFSTVIEQVIQGDLSVLHFEPSYRLIFHCVTRGHHDVWYRATTNFVERLHRRPELLALSEQCRAKLLDLALSISSDFSLFATKAVVARYNYRSIDELFVDEGLALEERIAGLKSVVHRGFTKLRSAAIFLCMFKRVRYLPGNSGYKECQLNFEGAVKRLRRDNDDEEEDALQLSKKAKKVR